jgi:hypothetical protein
LRRSVAALAAVSSTALCQHKTVIGTAEFVRNDDGGDPLAQCSAKQKGARE